MKKMNDVYIMDLDPCSYSSMFFAINVTVNYLYGYFVYSALFAFLLSTSIIHHSTKTFYTYVVDKLAIICVVLYGGYLFYQKKWTDNIILASGIILTFLSTIYLYYYGYTCDQYCFAPDKCESDWYHGLMHLISSVGHLMIVFL